MERECLIAAPAALLSVRSVLLQFLQNRLYFFSKYRKRLCRFSELVVVLYVIPSYLDMIISNLMIELVFTRYVDMCKVC